MYPKYFFENFWAPEQKNRLFVCMPFHNCLDKKFGKIKRVALQVGFDDAVRTKEGQIADDIMHEILDGIANSRTLLFDLSDDPKSSRINDNVLYELGVAAAIREPEDRLLIREKSSTKIPFDISHIRYHEYEGELQEDWLTEKLNNVIEGQRWYKSRRVAAAAKSIDSFGLKLIHDIYVKNPEGEDHFNDESMVFVLEAKLAILRLMDLGILWFATNEEGTEYAYHWTPFGKEVIKYLGIHKK